MLQKVTLFSALLISTIAIAQESYQHKVYAGVKSMLGVEYWNELPDDLEENDIAPPPLGILFGLERFKGKKGLSLHGEYSRSQTGLNFIHISFSGEGQLNNYLTLGLLVEIFNTTIGDANRFENTAFNKNMFGLGYFFKGQYKDFYLKFTHHLRKQDDAEIGDNEDSTTMVRHEWDNVIKFEAQRAFGDFMLIAEYAHLMYAKTKILSRDFGYIINDSSQNRFGLGIGHTIKKLDLKLMGYHNSEPDDEVSFYYQSPNFGPDYTLAKQFVSLEAKWRF